MGVLGVICKNAAAAALAPRRRLHVKTASGARLLRCSMHFGKKRMDRHNERGLERERFGAIHI